MDAADELLGEIQHLYAAMEGVVHHRILLLVLFFASTCEISHLQHIQLLRAWW